MKLRKNKNKKGDANKKNPEQLKEEQVQKHLTTLKLGHFQLNTSSFWITVICILCMFLVIQLSVNIFMYNKIMNAFLMHENRLVETIMQVEHKDSSSPLSLYQKGSDHSAQDKK